MISSRSAVVTLTLALTLGVPALARADRPPADESTGPDVRISFVLSRDDGAGTVRREVRLVVRPGWSSRVMLGRRVPIPLVAPSGSTAADANEPGRIAYSYQEIGFSAEISATVAEDGAIVLRGSLEDSAVDADGEDASRPAPPTVSALKQSFGVRLRDGVPQEIFAGDRPGLGKVSIEISATALR